MTLYQQKNTLSYSSNIVIDNILPDSVTEKIPSLWRSAKLYPPDKYKLVFKAVRRSIINQPDVGLCKRICENQEGAALFSMTYMLFKHLIRLPSNKISESAVRVSLEECKLPALYIDLMIQNNLDSNVYSKLESLAIASMNRRINLVNISWNINIALCSNSIGKIMEPLITLKFKLSNDKFVNFEVSAKQFHNLRYQISLILKAMINIENRQVLKIGT